MRPFGWLPDGSPVAAFALTNAAGMDVTIIEWGATIVRWLVPGHEGVASTHRVNVRGFDTLPPDLARPRCFGCTVGRYGSRIAHGRFVLDGRSVQPACNDGSHHPHGGVTGFDQRFWHADGTSESLVCRLHSPDGDDGYPGAMEPGRRPADRRPADDAETRGVVPGNAALSRQPESARFRPPFCVPGPSCRSPGH